MVLDNRSPLMQRLAEIMPKNLKEERWDGKSRLMTLDLHPIRMAAESFASWMGDELPANDEELRAMLWVFGEILTGHIERMLNVQLTQINDLLQVMPMPTMVVPKSEEN